MSSFALRSARTVSISCCNASASRGAITVFNCCEYFAICASHFLLAASSAAISALADANSFVAFRFSLSVAAKVAFCATKTFLSSRFACRCTSCDKAVSIFCKSSRGCSDTTRACQLWFERNSAMASRTRRNRYLDLSSARARTGLDLSVKLSYRG